MGEPTNIENEAGQDCRELLAVCTDLVRPYPSRAIPQHARRSLDNDDVCAVSPLPSASRRQKSGAHGELLRKLALKERPAVKRAFRFYIATP
jgi:hypothetical protein